MRVSHIFVFVLLMPEFLKEYTSELKIPGVCKFLKLPYCGVAIYTLTYIHTLCR